MNQSSLASPLDPPQPESHDRLIQWQGLTGSSASLAVSQLAQRNSGTLLLIVQDSKAVQRWQQDIDFFSGGQVPTLTLPDWETLPYDHFSPHQDIISTRLTTLARLPHLTRGIVLVTLPALLTRLAPTSYLSGRVFYLRCGEALNPNALAKQLTHAGYHRVEQVLTHGEFAIKGGLIDLFPMGSETPYRIELFDEEIDTIRAFDPDTQRSTETVTQIECLPAHEFPLTEDSIACFRQQWRSTFSGNPRDCAIYQKVSDGIAPTGVEYYLPLFFQTTATLFDYLPAQTRIISDAQITTAIQRFWDHVTQRYEDLRHDRYKPILPPHQLFIPVDVCHRGLNEYTQIRVSTPQLSPSDITQTSQTGSIPQNASRENYENHANSASSNQNRTTTTVLAQAPIEPATPTNATPTPPSASKKGHVIQFISDPPPTYHINHQATQPLGELTGALAQLDPNTHVLFCAESPGRQQTLLDLLNQAHIHPTPIQTWADFLASKHRYSITVADLAQGLGLKEPARHVISESQLFADHVEQRRWRTKKALDPDTLVKNLTELSIGTPVVHIEHGIGRYQGLTTLTTDNITAEYLILEYAGGDKIYVPVTSLHLISRYTSADIAHAPLHRLGSKQWQHAKQKAAQQITDVAAELLAIYSQRQATPGYAFPPPTIDFQHFKNAFPFEETDDQHHAIESVIADMTAPRPMDRLVCGDVGFGKTEVAMQAAFMAVHHHKQVAVLVPTTLLANQHLQTFQDRFADWPITIELLTRAVRGKEQDTCLARLAEGKIDIMIGTHRLLNPDVRFKALGLLIIDEEHRFGVKQKDQLKARRANVDVLTLTATPIPRTLNLAMSGTRDLSIIATPPARRLSIKSSLHDYNPSLIREAVTREMMRGGQVYFLHNDVASMETMANKLQAILPGAKLAMAHGQMRERALERVMSDFYHQRYDILLCSTIIESGIDVPTANTILINHADRFGLAQLHQIRGRVGRSHHQAYAYFLVNDKTRLTRDATQRLDAITQLEDLGAGFQLASHDLEIRGAGELLGKQQSGHIEGIGFSLYMELLEHTVHSLKKGEVIDPAHAFDRNTTDIELKLPTLIPTDYVPDVHTRLILYKRLANATSSSEIRDLKAEFIDRFGPLPPPTDHLFQLAHLKQHAAAIGIKKIDAGTRYGTLQFYDNPKIDFAKIIKMVQTKPADYQLTPQQTLRFKLATDPEQRIERVSQLLTELTT